MADYSINAVPRRVVYSGSAGVGPYAFTFEVLAQTDIAVYKNSTKLVLTTDYNVTINANGTGSVTLVLAATSTDRIIITGARAIRRTTDFATAGDLVAASLNEQLDANVIFAQQVAETTRRALTAPVYDPEHVDSGGTLDMTLPAAAIRASKLLGFDAAGNPTSYPFSSTPGTSTSLTFLQTGNDAIGRTIESKLRDCLSVKDFGAVGNGTANDTTAVQAALTAALAQGRALYIPGGTYKITSGLSIDFASSTGADDLRLSVFGDGSASSVLYFTAASGALLTIQGGTGGGVEANIKLADLYLKGASNVGTGLLIDNIAGLYLDNLRIRYFQYGIDATDWLSSNLLNCEIRWNKRNLRAQYTNFSRPNALNCYGTRIGNSYEYGVHIIGGSNFNFFGGTIEGNGMDTGVAASGRWGIKLEEMGVEGGQVCNVSGTYFENNDGTADIWLAQSLYSVGYAITSCSFNRISSTVYTTTNIKCDLSASTKRMIVALAGNAHQGLGTYVASASRPYIDLSGASGTLYDVKGVDQNIYGSATESPANGYLGERGQAYVEARFDGTLAVGDITSGFQSGRNVSTITKTATGDYTINYYRAMPAAANRYSFSLAGAQGIVYTFAETTTSVRIRTSDLSGTLTDFAPINVLVFGDRI